MEESSIVIKNNLAKNEGGVYVSSMPKKQDKPDGEWKIVPLRIQSDEARAVRDTAAKLGLSHQSTMRLAIEKGLPILLKALGKGGK